MNSEISHSQSPEIKTCCADKSRTIAYVIGIVGSFLIVAWLVSLMIAKTSESSVAPNRVKERQKNLTETTAANTEILNNYAWQNQEKKLVRLPIERAMELTVAEWKNPTAARSNLISRVEKATIAPPKPPEKPNPFE
ncbi:MAG: hypothetical protein M3Y82_08315 [Verrucomicrobiota bacterium]|nr:hypothetical protein [Verrucomicrobiota bacterium]